MTSNSQELNNTATGTSNNLDSLSKLLNSYLSSDQCMVFKSCQIKIKTNISERPLRLGRFMLNQNEHQFLLDHNGIYIFAVKDGNIIKGFRVIEAKMIKFKIFWQWDKLIYRKVD